MKLQLLFLLMDAAILLAYPVAYVWSKLRKRMRK
jgi:ABC-type spermidine/putrescine transport system permease subunit I